MTDAEYVRRMGVLHDQLMKLRSNKDFIINQPQADKLVAVLSFFLDEARRQDGNVEPIRLMPREEHGGVTATFLVFDIYGETVKRFCDVMKECSAITIDSTTDGICISCTIPEVFVPIKKS